MNRCALAVLALVALSSAGAANAALPKTHECQKPVRTGVEVWGLKNVTPAQACRPALALFAWEYATPAHTRELYGCRKPAGKSYRLPYLKLHRFRGWKLSLSGRYQEFTMSRGSSSFHVGGTDFPLNCT